MTPEANVLDELLALLNTRFARQDGKPTDAANVLSSITSLLDACAATQQQNARLRAMLKEVL